MKNYPKIGIRPTIDGRQGGVRESLEEKTMNLAKAGAELISSSNPQLSPSTSFLRVHVHLLLNLQIIRTEIPTSANNIPLPHNAT